MSATIRKIATTEFSLVRVVVWTFVILFAIIVVGSMHPHGSSRPTRARADIAGIESALVKMIADSGKSNLGQLLNPVAVQKAIGVTGGAKMTAEQFLAATNLYTRAYYALLRDGNGVQSDDEYFRGTEVRFRDVFNSDVVKRLRNVYMNIGFDPWQNLFNIYPGPWPTLNGPIPFRSYLQGTDSTGKLVPEADALTLSKDEAGNPILDPDTNESLVIGFPAPRDKTAFIWSNGANLVSGQAIYSPNQPYDPAHAIEQYDLKFNQEYALLGGGDDVNNWDQYRSWSRFY